MKRTALTVLAALCSEPALASTECSAEQWAVRLKLELQAGEPRCCFCIGTPEECSKEIYHRPKTYPGCSQSITFEYKSDKLTQQAQELLNNFYRALKQIDYRSAKVVLSGHTDPVGGDAFNLPLSQRRANTVKLFLIERGLGAELLQVEWYGAARPRHDATSMAENRRVEIRLVRSADIHR